jgi:DNA-binding LytR/AlgR family response regulator
VRIVIVEDEPAAARQLSRMIGRIDGLEISSLTVCSTIAEARERLKEGLDLLFLDLNIMGQSGMELLKEFVAGPFETIITTAYPDHALEAFEHGVRDYLVKPFSQDRLEQAVSRVPEPVAETPAMTSILVREKHGVTPVPVASIVMIRSAGDYCELFTKDGGSKLVSKRLDFLERRLPADFMRIHRTAIARVSDMESLKVEPGGKYSALIRGFDDPVPVGRKYYRTLKERLGEE